MIEEASHVGLYCKNPYVGQVMERMDLSFANMGVERKQRRHRKEVLEASSQASLRHFFTISHNGKMLLAVGVAWLGHHLAIPAPQF